ncbi:MAG: TonB-dependent receptor [Porphyromonas sp.]|nr:TonB-dependent receptor [Porphyromonas sp.]
MMSLLNSSGMGGFCRIGALGAATVVVAASSLFAQNNHTVKGVVRDAKNEPLVGVNVRVKGSNQGVATNLDGEFTLLGISKNASLELSYVGMETVTVAVAGRTSIEVVMKDNTGLLSDVVVVGYGRQKKVNLTGAVSSVDAKALASRPAQNVSQVLQGMVPGLNFSVGNGGGGLDSRMNINVRGAGTIGAGSSSSPLVLIDGVEGDMNTLSSTDIENISVLKDASASAIYGSRAAFGVILITTKSGREGRSRVNYHGSVRFSTATQVPEIMDSEMFANYFNRASTNAGSSAIFSEEIMDRIRKFKNGTIEEQYKYGTEFVPNDGEFWSKYTKGWANTEWFGYFYDKNVPSHEHTVSVSGGNKSLNYYISGGLLDQKGLLKVADDKFNRLNLTAKVGADITSWLNIAYSYRWTRENFERPSYMDGRFFHNIVRRWPTNAIYDPHGNLMPHNEAIQAIHGGRYNKVVDYSNQQLILTAKPIEGLTLRAENNYNTTYYNDHSEILPIYWYDDKNNPKAANWFDGHAPGMSEVTEYTHKNDFYSGRFYGEYARELGKHDFKVVGGWDLDVNNRRTLRGSKKDLITPEVPTLNTATNDKPGLGGGYNHWATMGFFARANYAYDSRYLLEVSLRRDGSSRFVGDKRWATFPSFSAGWNIANESFWEGLRGTVSLLKLRGSWGALGNTNINALYPWFQALSVQPASNNTGSNWLINGNRQMISSAPGIVSDALTWERVSSWNLGLDFAAFNNRLQGSFDYFVRNTFDMVGPAAPLTSLLGTGQPSVNNADMRSRGWELELRWRDRIGDFSYGAKLILSDNIAEVTKYYNPTNTLSTWYTGRRVGEIWGYTTKGIAQTNEEMTAHLATAKQTALGNNWAAGDIMYADLNGDNEINAGSNKLGDSGDLSIIGNSSPRYSYSFTADAAWKGFDLQIMLQGVGKRDFFTDQPYFAGANHGQWQSVGFTEHWDFWRPEGDPLGANTGAYYPRVAFGSSGKNFKTQTRFLQDASYLRIKNLQLGYTLPEQFTRKFGVSSLRVYTSVDNLVTFTKLSKIFDPEGLGGDWGAGKLYPLQRTWSFGINVGI